MFNAQGKKVLVVDDNLINITIIKAMLKKTGMSIDTATSGMQCLEKVKSNTFDIILLDSLMPEMDGIETLRRLKMMKDNIAKEAKVIVITADADIGAKEEYVSYGFDDFIPKPIDAKELEMILKQYI